jgi:hypothetical protein
MPKEITHWILAERVLAGLNSGSRTGEIIRDHRELYLAGAVLPDTLLHLFRGPDAPVALALANVFHDAGDNSYAPLIRIEQRFPNGLPAWLLACLLGVLTHMQGDIIFHPYVFSMAGIDNMGRHYRMETAIDVYLLRRDAIVTTRHLRSLVTPQIREELVTAGSLLFDPEGKLHPSSIGKALDLHCRFQGMYDLIFCKIMAHILGRLPGSPLKWKQHLFYPLDMSRHDAMLPESSRWLHPVTGKRHTANINELADQAVLRTIAVFKDIEKQGSLATVLAKTPGENLLTGMYGVKQHKIKNFINSNLEYSR